MAKKRTFREFKQGIYRPTHKEKCLNKEPVVYRSMLECRAMRFFDNSANVIKWGSEIVIIPYKKFDRMARYFVDIYAEMKIGDQIKKFIFEIKPFSQTKEPVASNRKKQSTILYENKQYAINTAKWEAATKFATLKGMEFGLLTEKNIEQLESGNK